MKTINARELHQETSKILLWVENGEEIAVSKRGKVIARVIPEPQEKTLRKVQMPDFAARLKRIYGDKVLPYNIVLKMREEEAVTRPW